MSVAVNNILINDDYKTMLEIVLAIASAMTASIIARQTVGVSQYILKFFSAKALKENLISVISAF